MYLVTIVTTRTATVEVSAGDRDAAKEVAYNMTHEELNDAIGETCVDIEYEKRITRVEYAD